MRAYLEQSEVQQLEKAATCLRDKLLIRILARVGCRISEALGAWQRRNQAQEETLPLLSVGGLSTRANRALKGAFAAWLKRDLCQKEIVYLFVDDLYLGARGQEPGKGRGPGSPQHQSPRQASGSSPKPGRWAHL